jgi:hypothetical protein
MAAFQDQMTEALNRWAARSGAVLSPAARQRLESLIASAEQRLGPQRLVADPRPTENLHKILDAAMQASGTNVVDERTLESALSALCPLFPFC